MRRTIPIPLHLLLGLALSVPAAATIAPAAFGATEENGVVVVTAEEIARMKARKIADVLNHIPGVEAGDSSVGIHGSYKVKVLLDGRPLNDPTSSYGAVNLSVVDPDQVERIEILRGKGGVRYGQDASGGVILITSRAVREISASAKAYGGNLETGYGQASVQGRSGRWTAEAGGEAETTQGYTVNNDDVRHQGGVRLAYAVDDERSVQVSADFIHQDQGLSGLPDFPTPHSRKTSETTVLAAQAKALGFTSATSFNSGENHNTDVSKNLDQRLRVNELGETLTSAFATGGFGTMEYGLGYRLAEASSDTFAGKSEETFSLFASQNLNRGTSPWTLTAGLRANCNTAFDDALNPEIKLAYQREHWGATLSYSGSNNTPSFHQRYNRTSSTRPNPNLDMETADNYSLAATYTPIERLSLRASVFYNRLSDRISYITGTDGVGQYENLGEVTYRGGDLAVNWRAADNLGIRAGYTYLKAVDEETGLYVTAKSKHRATLDCSWQATENLMIVLSGKYVSKAYLYRDNSKSTPGYALADMRAEYRLDRRWALFAEIDNLADTAYSYADGLLAPPLTWLAGMSWKL